MKHTFELNKRHIWWCKRQITFIERHIWTNTKDVLQKLWNTHLNWTKNTFDDAKDRLRLSKDTFELTQKTYYKTHIWIDQKAHLVMQKDTFELMHPLYRYQILVQFTKANSFF